jgi:general secretion pathway protein K
VRALPHRQRGIAILTAMLVVAIATVIAVNLLWETGVDLQRTENLLTKDQTREFALAGEAFATVRLEADARSDGPAGIDSLDEDWAFGSPRYAGQDKRPFVVPVDAAVIAIYGEDMQGLFNLNNLVDSAGKPREVFVEQFTRLLQSFGGEEIENPVDPSLAAALTDRVVDWIDPDTQAGLSGAEEDVYTSRPVPHRAANFWFVSVSELMAIEGMTPEIYAALEANVIALPPLDTGKPTTLNVNTAMPAVIASLGTGLTADMVTSPAQPYQDVSEFVNDLQPLLTGPFDARFTELLATSSGWFRSTVTTSIGQTRTTLYSLLELTENGQVRTRLRTWDAPVLNIPELGAQPAAPVEQQATDS